MGKAIATVLPAGTNSLLLTSSCDNDDISCLAGFWQLCRRVSRHLQGSDAGELLSDTDSTYRLINHKDHNALPPYNNQHRIVNVTEIGNPIVRGWIGEEEDEIKKAVLAEPILATNATRRVVDDEIGIQRPEVAGEDEKRPQPPSAPPPPSSPSTRSKRKGRKKRASDQEKKILLVGEEEHPPLPPAPSYPNSTYQLIKHKDHFVLPPYNNHHCIVDVIEIENPNLRGWIGEEEDEIKKAVLVETERQPLQPPPPGPPSTKSKSKKRASLGPYNGQEQKILLVGEEERPPPSLGPYNREQRILLVGDGDFSFSASLALAFGDASNIIATSLDSYEFLKLNYSKAAGNIKELTSRSCKVIHGVDATKMVRHPELRSLNFDRIVYNFPHAGFDNRGDTREAQIKTHQKLVTKFLKNARRMIKEDGQIHITHKCAGFFLEWNITLLGRRIGLRFVEESPFDLELYPGYATKFGFGGDANFNCFPAKTYKFNLPTPKPNKK